MRKLLALAMAGFMIAITGCSALNMNITETTEPVPTVHRDLIEYVGDSTTVNGIEVGFTGISYDDKLHNLVLNFHYVNVSDDYRDIGMNDVKTFVNGNKKYSNFYGCHLNAGEESDGRIEIGINKKEENVDIELFFYQTETPFLSINTEIADDFLITPTTSPTPSPSETGDNVLESEETTTQTPTQKPTPKGKSK